MAFEFDWLDESGWCLVLPKSVSSQWSGVASDDYQRLSHSASAAWISELPVGGGVAFVLGGDPGMALVHTMPDGVVKIIRWQCAESEHDLVEFALRGAAAKETEPDIVFTNGECEWLLSDATADLAAGHLLDVRDFRLPLGTVCLSTAYLEHDLNAAIVHTFTPVHTSVK